MKKRTFQTANVFTFKTALHTGTLLCLGATFFINPAFVLLICAYYLFRFFSFIVQFDAYEKWKREQFAKNDTKLTQRKLLYFLKKCQEYGLKDVNVYNQNADQFRAGFMKLDPYMRIELTYDEENYKYKSKLSFQGHDIATSEGYAFQKVKWNTKKYPELEKAFLKVFLQIEQDVRTHEKESKKATLKNKKKAQAREDALEEALAKKIRQTYKKDMSI